MNKKTSKEDRTLIMSDAYVRESGTQGGKIIAEHIAVGSCIIGILLFFIGVFSLLYMLCVNGYPPDLSPILLLFSSQSLAIIIGLLLISGGYFAYRDKHQRNKTNTIR